MNFNGKSKFEINKLVAQALGMRTDKALLPNNTLSHGYNEKYPNTVWASLPGQAWEQFSWTGEHEHWGQLIDKYCININFDATQVHAQSYFCENGKASESKEDIGLAVAIAFLKYTEYQKMLTD